jgi:PIN domain nuclease of toxin-antitoxin system
MNLLMDTHVVIWFITDHNKLPLNIKALIENINNRCYVSIASYWEMGIKNSLGRLDLKQNIDVIFNIIEESGFESLPITKAHIVENTKLPFYHQDPFDRIIVAQSIIDGLTLITKDSELKKYYQESEESIILI